MMSRDQTWREAGGLCWYCGCLTHNPDREGPAAFADRMRLTFEAYGTRKLRRRMQATREHLIRKCEGGSDAAGNIVLACQHCNVSRQGSDSDAHKVLMLTMVKARVHPCHPPFPHGLGPARILARSIYVQPEAP